MRTARSLFLLVLFVLMGVSGIAEARHRHPVRIYPRYRYRPHAAAHGGVIVSPLGWYGGVGLVGTKILGQAGGPEQLESGGGVSLFTGVRVNRLAIELGWMESLHNPATLNSFGDVDYLFLDAWMLDARLFFGSSENVEPYLQAGVGLYALGSQYFGLDSVGTGFQLGGGFEYWVGNFITLGARLRYHGIAMGPPEGGEEDTFVSAATVEGSLGLHF